MLTQDHKYSTEHQQIYPFFEPHPPRPYAYVIYGWFINRIDPSDIFSSHYDTFVDKLSFYCRKLKIAQDEFEASEFFLDFLQSWTAFSKQDTQVDRIVCLGLGNFAQSPNSSSQVSSKFQLLLLLSFAKHANIANNDEVFVYDPILTCSEKKILTKLNLKLFETNQEGHYLFEKNTTVYFLPHCPKQLLNNLLWSNWDNLDFVYIIGNSFKNINLNFSANQLQSVKYIQQVSDVIKGNRSLHCGVFSFLFQKKCYHDIMKFGYF